MSEARRFTAIAAHAEDGARKRLQRHRLVSYAATIGVLAVIVPALAGCSLSASSDQAASSASSASSVTATQDYNTATSLALNGHCDRAIPMYLRAINKSGMYVNAYVGLGNCYQGMGNFQAAIAQYNHAIQVDPTNYFLYFTRAGAEAANGSTGAAAADDRIALQYAPKQVPTYESIAGINNGNGFAAFQYYDDAIKVMSQAIALVPSNPKLYQDRASIYLLAQDSKRAFDDYQMAIKVAPYLASRASIYADLATVYDQQSNYEQAYFAIGRAVQLEPINVALHLQSGSIHSDGGRYDGAIDQYNKALRLVSKGPNAVAAHEGKANALAALGKTSQAIDEYRQALQLSKKDPGAQARLKGEIKATQAAQS